MTDKLEKLWKEYGYPSAPKLYQITKQNNIKMKLDDIKKFIADHRVGQIHKQVRKEKPNKIITAPAQNSEWQIDLLDMSSFASANKGYKWILIAVDIFTRKAGASALKSKTPKYALVGLENVIKVLGKPHVISTDDGSEWKSVVETYLKDKKILHRVAEVGDHNRLGIINRFSRTIKDMLYKSFTANDSNDWIDNMKTFIGSYNKTTHTNLCGMTPNEAEKRPADTLECQHRRQVKLSRPNTKRELQINDIVRVRIGKTKFSKGYENKFTKETYTIKEIDLPFYILDNNEKYKASDLQKVNQKDKSIDKVRIAKRQKLISQELKREGINKANVQPRGRNWKPIRKTKTSR